MDGHSTVESLVETTVSPDEDTEQTLKLYAAQERLEGECMALGAANFKQALVDAEQSGEASRIGAYSHLLAHGIAPVQKALEQMLLDSVGRAGRKHVALPWIALVGADVAAYMALKVALDSIALQSPVHKAARALSGLILDELRYRRFKTAAPQLWEYKKSRFTTSHYGHMKRSLDHTLSYAEIDVSGLDMTPAHRFLVGCTLLNVVAETTTLIEPVLAAVIRRKRIHTPLYLVPTQLALDWLAKANATMADFATVHYPMVVPPLPWAAGERGGYRFQLRNKYGIARGWQPSEHLKQLESREMPLVYETLNTLQEVAWCVNRDVLELIQQCERTGVVLPGLAAVERAPLPPKPANIDDDIEVRRVWRRKASVAKEQNRLRGIRVVEQLNIVRVAEQMSAHGRFYFPFNCDFRGRIYTISSYLQPQGDDLSKALLTFSEGKELGESGAVWLALHGAACLEETPEGEKISKMTLAERVGWIQRHTAQIEAVAASPLTHTWWMQAGEPLQFYAFACDWSRAMAAYRATGSWTYRSALPCGMDGTCNGLQHFNAMFRDAEGGRLVNLTDNERPQDVYDAVAIRVNSALQELVASSADTAVGDIALLWLKSGLVTRKLCKRPTMTFGYGSKKWGFRDQLLAELVQRDDYLTVIRPHFASKAHARDTRQVGKACKFLGAVIETVLNLSDGVPFASSFLAGVIETALCTEVRTAVQAMQWLQRSAALITATNKPVQWTVPATNFLVRQEYYKLSTKRVVTMLAGHIVRPRLYDSTSDVLGRKQTNSIAANVVHSLDAAALMLAVTQASAEGIASFGMIHDSYSTVAADCELLAQITRRTFVQLYTENKVVEELGAELVAQMAPDEEEIPVPPTLGTLDLTQVLRSKYFFA